MKTYFNEKIEKIICPFDFTETGRAGLEYAGLLSSALGASLTIFYVQPSDWSETHQLYEDLNDNTRAIKRLLKIEIKAMEDLFGIECDYAVEPTTDTVLFTVGAISADYDLIVMGTNGADELYQHVFGTNSHHTLGLARCPVLMIPEGYIARIPQLIVYANDPYVTPAFPVDQLKSLALPLKATIHNLHVVPVPSTSLAEQKFELLGELLGVNERTEFDWGFEPIYSDEIVTVVDAYMKDHDPDILALSYHHRLLFEKIFEANVLKPISRIADYPVLVFWH